jgi:hypothetical protein
MAFLLSRRPLTFAVGLGVSSAFATHAIYRMRSSPMLCEPASTQVKDAFTTYERDAKMPVVKDGRVNTAAYKQISSGSLLGMRDHSTLHICLPVKVYSPELRCLHSQGRWHSSLGF